MQCTEADRSTKAAWMASAIAVKQGNFSYSPPACTLLGPPLPNLFPSSIHHPAPRPGSYTHTTWCTTLVVHTFRQQMKLHTTCNERLVGDLAGQHILLPREPCKRHKRLHPPVMRSSLVGLLASTSSTPGRRMCRHSGRILCDTETQVLGEMLGMTKACSVPLLPSRTCSAVGREGGYLAAQLHSRRICFESTWLATGSSIPGG